MSYRTRGGVKGGANIHQVASTDLATHSVIKYPSYLLQHSMRPRTGRTDHNNSSTGDCIYTVHLIKKLTCTF